MFFWSILPFSTPVLLALRNMQKRWLRSLLTMMGIVVGVAAMVSVSATNASTLDSINRFFDEAAGQSNLLVESTIAGQGFDESLVNLIGRFEAVVAAAPAGQVATVLAGEEWQIQIAAGGTITPGSQFWLLGIDPQSDPLVHDYRLVSGRLLEIGEQSYNVVLVENYATEKKLTVGDNLSVIIPPTGLLKLRIVGLIAKEGVGVTNEGSVGFVPLNVVQEQFNLAGQITQIEIKVNSPVANDPNALEQLRQDIQERLGNDVDVKYPAARGQVVASTLRNYQLGLNFFSVVSLFVGSFLIYNAFAMTVVERTREIGMLRAIGTTRRQIMGLMLTEAILSGVIGSFTGVGVGLLLARGLIVFMSSFTGQAITIVSADPDSLTQALLIGLGVTLLAAAIPAWQASHISPLQALRIKGNVDEGRWFQLGLKFGPLTVVACFLILYRVPFRPEVAFAIGSNSIFMLLLGATLCIPILAGRMEQLTRPVTFTLFGNEGRLGSGNVNRAPGRTTLTIAALMVGISMVIGISGLTNSFETDIQEWVSTAIGGDLYVRSPIGMRLDLETRLLALDGVTAVSKANYIASRLILADGRDEFAVFAAIDPATYLQVGGLRVDSGPPPPEIMSQLAAGDGILLSAGEASQYGLEVGDTIYLETRRGRRPFQIIAIIVDFSGGDVPFITGSWGDLRRYFGINEVSRYTVSLKPEASFDQISQQIKNDLGRGQNLAIESRADFQAQIANLTSQAFALFDVLGLIGLVVAALGVINTMLMNVLERTRELGGLRSLGMTRRQVQNMILAEALTIGLIGSLFGLAFGIVLTDVFIIGLRSVGGFVLQKQLPYPEIVASFFLGIFVAISAALYPAFRAGRVNIVEAIKNE